VALVGGPMLGGVLVGWPRWPAPAPWATRIRSAQMMLRFTDPDLTAAQLDGDGWFRSGDPSTLDEAGYLRVTGRKKDIVNRGGEKLSAQVIEAAIFARDLVAEVAVVGSRIPASARPSVPSSCCA
jgi:long-subunit acyl-CoA synthetase (AMP-forming)